MLFWVFCQLLNWATQAEKARYHLTARCQLELATNQLKADPEIGDNTIRSEFSFKNSTDSPHVLWSVIKNHCSCHQSGSPSKHSEYDFCNSGPDVPSVQGIWVQFSALLQMHHLSIDESLSLWLTSPLTSDVCTAFLVSHVNLFRLRDNARETIFHNKGLDINASPWH